MALVIPTTTDISGDGSVRKFTWTLTTADHTGAAVDWCQWADRSVLFQSVAWGAATAVVEGSNDGIVFVGLADPQGTPIAKTANGIEAVLELTQWVQPRLSVVGAGATIVVSMVLRRNQPMRT